jgi:hypothetical protein
VTVTRALALGMLITIIPGASALADPIGMAPTADAFLNLGNGPYASSNLIATGSPQAWYNSAQVVRLFGGVPTAQQQQSFDQAILQRVQQTFQLSGVNVTLTTDANAPAEHTLSLVSNAASAAFTGSIGTTEIGGNGMSFIDPIAQAAGSVDQLEWIAAHNISHELMLAFGVGENYDTTGNYIDARNANMSMFLDPNATFSTGAAQALKSQLPNDTFTRVLEPRAQALDLVPAPEPATVAMWGFLAAAGLVIARRRQAAR